MKNKWCEMSYNKFNFKNDWFRVGELDLEKEDNRIDSFCEDEEYNEELNRFRNNRLNELMMEYE